MTKSEIEQWLREDDEERLALLWSRADGIRKERVGEEVHLRGLIEMSNHCARACGYCGLRAENRKIGRYRMSTEEVLACAKRAVLLGYGTVVIQAGEDDAITLEGMSDIIRSIKSSTSLAITLSLGERSEEEFRAWREAGADRYLLRFETSNRALFHHIHPPRRNQGPADRIEILHRLGAIGYEVGSGVLIGVPSQTYSDLAEDVCTFRELDLDMIGVGPYIPHPDTPLFAEVPDWGRAGPDQAHNTELMAYKMVALTRIACPDTNIPSTSALATLNKAQGRELGLMRGANVCMPNLTPVQYRAMYEIYPGKACINETAEQCSVCLAGRIHSIGRVVGKGRGDSANWHRRRDEAEG